MAEEQGHTDGSQSGAPSAGPTWIGAEAPALAAVQQAAATAVQAVVQAYAATPNLPAGPAQRDRAFASLPNELERILGYVTRPVTWSLSAPHPDLVGLQTTRLADRLALNRWAADALQDGSQPEEVLAGFDAGNLQQVVALQVLGTLSAVRSSALATGRTTVQALVGTAIGVAIGAPLRPG